ncbi:unnamed protein product [Polarella glacialis]|uniref:Ubiquitin-like domain-containing protein n=1 Tax=Polarella glacialis TaxID=89957 RepID=A0A813DQP0_POLGL|nr:unnamed protein product [Polarella glacialis]
MPLAPVVHSDKVQLYLTVRVPDGMFLILDVKCGDTVQSAKPYLAARMVSAEDDFYLIFQGSEIENHKKLADYSIRNTSFTSTSTLTMRCRHKGGGGIDRSETQDLGLQLQTAYAVREDRASTQSLPA